MVKAGDIVRVKVMEVDQQRKRIALSMRLNDKAEAAPREQRQGGRPDKGKSQSTGRHASGPGKSTAQGAAADKGPATALAAAFASARKDR